MSRAAIILKTTEKDSLFYSDILWVRDALTRASFSEVYEAEEAEIISILEKNSENDIFITFSDLAFIDEEVIDSAAAVFAASEKDILCAYNPESRRFVLWGKAPALADLIKQSGLDYDSFDKSKVAFSEFASRRKFLSSLSPSNLFEMNKLAKNDIIEKHIMGGVTFLSSDGVLISPRAKIGEGTTILSGTIIKGETVIGKNCVIGPNSYIEESVIGDSSEINSSYVRLSKVGNGVSVGPFSQLRPDTVLADKVHVGDFVEIKNSNIGEGTAVAHLTYVGDSDVGKNVNFGCGVVTVNYDGENKNRTRIGDYSFIGCNTNLVAPVSVGDKAYTAAGSTITKDVPSGALAIARNRQENKENWADKKLSKYVEKKSNR